MMKGMHKYTGTTPEMYPAFVAKVASKDFIDTTWLEDEEPDVEFRRKIENEGKIVYEIIAEC